MADTAHGRPMTEAVWQRAELLAEMLDRLQCRAVALRLDRGDAFARASRRCLACPCPSRCRLWLELRGSGCATPPAFCANAGFLAAACADALEQHAMLGVTAPESLAATSPVSSHSTARAGQVPSP